MEDPEVYDTAIAMTRNSLKVQHVTAASINIWHDWLGHVSKDILLHLEESSIGVKLSSTKFN